MKSIIELRVRPDNYWQVADVLKDGEKITTINCFYEVDKDWILIYETLGGSGYGYRKGKVIEKIFIGDSEFKTTYV